MDEHPEQEACEACHGKGLELAEFGEEGKRYCKTCRQMLILAALENASIPGMEFGV